MKLKLIGEGTFLAPFASVHKSPPFTLLPDGTIRRGATQNVQKGHQVPGWSGASWAGVSLVWYPRPMWVIEAVPKDPYYNFGKLIFYMDKENYVMYFKPMYSWGGEYSRTFLYASRVAETQHGQRWIGDHIWYLTVDDKRNHSSVAEPASTGIAEAMQDLLTMPVTMLGTDHFSETYIRQLSK